MHVMLTHFIVVFDRFVHALFGVYVWVVLFSVVNSYKVYAQTAGNG